jgi:hypothetical protein
MRVRAAFGGGAIDLNSAGWARSGDRYTMFDLCASRSREIDAWSR